MKKLPNAVKWLIIVAVLAAMAALTWLPSTTGPPGWICPRPDNTSRHLPLCRRLNLIR